MSSGITYSRAQVYEMFKGSQPITAKNFLFRVEPIFLISTGVIILIASVAAVVFMSTFTSIGEWVVPLHICTGITGVGFTFLGLVFIAHEMYMKHRVMNKQLSRAEINAIAGKMLIDPLAGLMTL